MELALQPALDGKGLILFNMLISFFLSFLPFMPGILILARLISCVTTVDGSMGGQWWSMVVNGGQRWSTVGSMEMNIGSGHTGTVLTAYTAREGWFITGVTHLPLIRAGKEWNRTEQKRKARVWKRTRDTQRKGPGRGPIIYMWMNSVQALDG